MRKINLILGANILVALFAMAPVNTLDAANSQVAFRGEGAGGARVHYNTPNYYNDRRAYDRGFQQGANYNSGVNGGGFVDEAAPYTPPTQGVIETPGYTDPYQSNDSIIPSYDQD